MRTALSFLLSDSHPAEDLNQEANCDIDTNVLWAGSKLSDKNVAIKAITLVIKMRYPGPQAAPKMITNQEIHVD